jgi:hypothetical protein
MLIFYTIISSNYYYINYKYMLVQDDVRNSVIHLIAKRRRWRKSKVGIQENNLCYSFAKKLVSIRDTGELKFLHKSNVPKVS